MHRTRRRCGLEQCGIFSQSTGVLSLSEKGFAGEIVIESLTFNESGEFEISFRNLMPSATYQLRRSTDLQTFDLDIEAPFSGNTTRVVIDTDPLEKAFYRLLEVVAP